MNSDIRSVGKELVAAARASFSAQQGILEELFPYIYQASKRMSTRAISRWLAETQAIKLSDVSIAKALRNAEQYWKGMVDEIEPVARVFAEAHKAELEDVLFSRQHFEKLREEPPWLNGVTVEDEWSEVKAAELKLEQYWFKFDDEILEHCRPYLVDKTKIKVRLKPSAKKNA